MREINKEQESIKNIPKENEKKAQILISKEEKNGNIIEKFPNKKSSTHESILHIFDKKGERKKMRLIQDHNDAVKQVITADVIEVRESIATENVTVTISSGTVLTAKDAIIEAPESLSVEVPTQEELK